MTRCLHPPGGAAALTAIVGGPSVTAAGFTFALAPVCVNSILLVLLGLVFHKFSRHSYPHVPAIGPANTHGITDLAPQYRVGFQASDIDAALKDSGETFDIDREDLDPLLLQAESRALTRSLSDLSCGDVMSRDIVSIDSTASVQTAHSFLLDHGVRTLPVTDPFGRLVGTVGLRELARHTGCVADVMTAASVSKPEPMEPITGTISVTEEPDSIAPVAPHEAFLAAAVGLMRGAMVLAAASPSESALALALLSGQILECSLKAFLSKAGLTEPELKKVGHNLSALWTLAATKGLPIRAIPPDWTETLNRLHDSPYNLRYPMGVHGLVLPNAQQTTSELGHLIDTVRQTIG